MKNILLTILVLSTATSKLMAYDASFSHARKFYAKEISPCRGSIHASLQKEGEKGKSTNTTTYVSH